MWALRWGLGTLWYCPSTLIDPPRTLCSSVGTIRCCPRSLRYSPRTLRSSVGTVPCCYRTLRHSPRTLRSSVGTLRCCPRNLMYSPRTLRSSVGTLRCYRRSFRQDSCTSSNLVAQVFLRLIEDFPRTLCRVLRYLIHYPSTTSGALVLEKIP